MRYLFYIIIFSIFSCEKLNNQYVWNKIEKDIKNSINMHNAKKFDYDLNVLHPQKSYFVDSKIKYLYLKSAGEFLEVEDWYCFDIKSDSLIVQHSKISGIKDDVNIDTLYTYDLVNKQVKIFVGNKEIKSSPLGKFDFKRFDYIYQVKKETEQKYKVEIIN